MERGIIWGSEHVRVSMRAFLMMVSWLSSFLALGSSLPLVETPPHVLGKAQPCHILSVSGTNTNYCHCVTFSPRDFASLRAVVTGQCYTERLNGNV